MQLLLNENRIVGYTYRGFFEGGVEVPDDYINDNNQDKIGYLIYNGKDSPPIFDELKYIEDQKNQEIDALRRRRENECFEICDRAVWYDTLTDAQKTDVRTWRQAWLEVTDTLIVPKQPHWLQEKNNSNEVV